MKQITKNTQERSFCVDTKGKECYNSKYERIGYLFQDRYKSEAVKDDVCFVAVLRYVLNNLSERPGEFIPALRAAGLSIRQINRLTGISFGIVRKY